MLAEGGFQTENEATLNLLNSLLGNSLLALPWAFSKVGFLLGVVLLGAGTALNRYSLHLLLDHVDMEGGGTYPLIGRCAFGWSGEVVVLVVYLMTSSGALCAYAVGLADLVGELVPGTPRPLSGLLAVALCAPGMFQPGLKKVVIFSKISLGCAICFVLVLLTLALSPTPVGAQPLEQEIWRPDQMFVAWPIFGYMFAVQPSGMIILSRLEARGRQPDHMDEDSAADLREARARVTLNGYVVSIVIGYVIGVSSYKRFGEHTQGNIIRSIHDSPEGLLPGCVVLLQLSSAVMLLCSAAFVMVSFRFAVVEVMRLVGVPLPPAGEDIPTQLRHRITCGVLCGMCVVSMACDDISIVYRAIGSVATQFFALILPGAFSIRLGQGMAVRKMWGPLLITILGVIALVLCFLNLVAA